MTNAAPTPAPLCGSSYSPWTPMLDGGSFSLRTVPGYFLQGHDHTENLPPYAPRLGLMPKLKWSNVDSALDAHEAKLLIFLRHGEGLHNADKARVGAAAWEQEYQFRPEYCDAPLTSLGIEQSISAGAMLDKELTGGGLALDLVVVSPLDRTLHTYAHACGGLSIQAPVISLEITRETLGVCPCDQRKSMAPKILAFPSVDFSCVHDEEDPWWTTDHRETDDEIDDRARAFLRQMFHERSERRILVVSHSGFSRACFRALGHRYYRPSNGELIPVIVHEPRHSSEEL